MALSFVHFFGQGLASRFQPERRIFISLAVGIFLYVGMRQQASAAPPQESATEAKTDQAVVKINDVQSEPAKANDQIAYHGSVVDEDGNPIEGAEVWYALPTALGMPLGIIIGTGEIRKVAVADSKGGFSFSVPRPKWTGFPYALTYMLLTARAPGYGCDWLPLTAFESNPDSSEVRGRTQREVDETFGKGRFASRTLKLPKEAGQVQGRLVDLNGQPLSGVEICVESIHAVDVDLLKKAFETSSPEMAEKARRVFASHGWLSSVDWQVLFPRPKTDQNGEFTLRGLGRNQSATVTLLHPRVDAEKFYIIGADMEPQLLALSSMRGFGRKEMYVGIKFQHAVGPAIPITGVVTELQSGKPVAGAEIYVERLFARGNQQVRFARHISTVTDQDGRYSLIGIPAGTGHRLQINPKVDEPLFSCQHEFSIDSNLQTETVDVQLWRGVWIEGRVTDAETGDPLEGIIDYFPFRKNSDFEKSKLGFRNSDVHQFFVDKTGHYRLPGLSGPGVVALRIIGPKIFPKGGGAETIEGYDAKTGRLSTVMLPRPVSSWNQISFVDPPNGVATYEHNIRLSAGLSLAGRVLAPDGSPATDVEAFGLNIGELSFQKLEDELFNVVGYSEQNPRDLFFVTKDRSLVGYLHLEGKAPASATVQLQPAVTVRGRLIDTETEEPASGYYLRCRSSKYGGFRLSREQETSNEQGRFEVKGLLAGNVYRMAASSPDRGLNPKNGFIIDLTDAKPGDVIELDDVTGKNAKK